MRGLVLLLTLLFLPLLKAQLLVSTGNKELSEEAKADRALYAEERQTTISGFQLMNVDGKTIALSDYKTAKGLIVVFTCNHCPFAKLYPPRLNALQKKYSARGVFLLAISSTDTVTYEEDSFANMILKAKKENFNFPYLYDADQSVAKLFGAQKTPHAFVLWNDKGNWTVKYNGAIDDNGMAPGKVNNEYVANAVEALLSGKEPLTTETKSIGCQIYFRN